MRIGRGAIGGVILVTIGLVIAGCGSDSGSGNGGSTYNPAIIGTVSPSFIQDPPAELVSAAGLSSKQAAAAVAQARKFTWQLVSAGGVTQAATCTGSGSPTIVYSNGLLLQAAWTWPVIATEQAKTNRVCMFDRPGTGLSPARPESAKPNGPVANANEMYAMLTALGEKGPYTLVGWSYGGMVVRTAAALQPDQVAGMNLIDAVVPSQYRTFDRSGWEEAGQSLDMAAAEKAVAAAPNIGAKPLVVLQAGIDNGDSGAPSKQWTEAQRQSAAISTNSVWGVVTKAAHTIPQQAPAAVEASGTAITESVTSGQPMPACPATFPASGIVCKSK